ncbi:DUF2242 domain-containing protein [[Pseudomonas] boreopolis]|uniref:DUF2242 domain-containing protein n=1 Tax=Xanthomonas boreopolis TaxID=86183 RepID=A0A919KJK8_9XANT|nr:hypothetical protein GCM10009090_27810 [[Pseudomonas] boreopolis]
MNVLHKTSAIGLLLATGLSGCGGKGDTMLMRESFNSDNTYSRSFDAKPAVACEAARRALLSQGYIVARADAATVEGSKNFQPKDDLHEQLDLRVSCVPQGEDKSWVFVSALQDRYALKKSPTSASVGVSVLGSVSLPIGSTDDSLVKVASSTVQDADFYNRFFERVQLYLPPAPAQPAPPSPPAQASEAVPEAVRQAPPASGDGPQP